MKTEELQIGKCYSRNDDALYKVVSIGEDWVLALVYSFNHNNCCPWIFTPENFVSDGLEEIDENLYEWYYQIFDSLKYKDYNTLTD